jgi:glycosyltransferase involved in cell wall biosynthesis
MRLDVCYIYPWATLGGVERVLLNRAIAAKRMAMPVRLKLYFYHDSGGVGPINEMIRSYKLENYCEVVDTIPFDADLYVSIDSQEAVEYLSKRGLRYFVETHTSYPKNRQYLRFLPDSCLRVVVPSEHFAEAIAAEFPPLQKKISVLRNFVPWDIAGRQRTVDLPDWTATPVLYLGRLDAWKNPLEVIDAAVILNSKHPREFIFLFCGPVSGEIDFYDEVQKRSLSNITLRLPPIHFSRVPSFVASLAARRAIFVSPSKGESFGLSAAECIAAGMPVVLSDIDAHKSLVGDNHEQIYRLGSAADCADRIVDVERNYERHVYYCTALRAAFSAEAYLADWDDLVSGLVP